ncbi:MAG: hypothetical protein HOE90_20385 [Bacteriovoracaceae bacterium]|jgi:hypothetical protein|nr:hypothetical protein [Bacteriovoracaceae bacterium]
MNKRKLTIPKDIHFQMDQNCLRYDVSDTRFGNISWHPDASELNVSFTFRVKGVTRHKSTPLFVKKFLR